jgi:predicted DNA-binding ribbon-helix-helix protein
MIDGRKTSVSLEDEFWNGLIEMAENAKVSVRELIRQINSRRRHSNLSSALRLAVFAYYDRRRNN